MKLIYSIHKYDVFMFNWLNNVSIHASLVRSSRYISKTGDGQLYILLAAWIYWAHGFQNPILQSLFLAFVIERPVYFILKNSFKRNRPQQVLINFRSAIIPSDTFSFPSGHTSAACMVATLVSYFYPEMMPAVYFWSALVGFSRVVLGVHFPTDTIIGAALGVGAAIFSLNLILL